MDRRIHRFRSEKVEVMVLQYDDSDDHRGLPNELTHFGNLRWLLTVLGLDSSSTLLRFFCEFKLFTCSTSTLMYVSATILYTYIAC